MSDAGAGALTAEQREALEVLAAGVDASAYLAGGLAVAVYLGPRRSIDLDVFTSAADPTTSS